MRHVEDKKLCDHWYAYLLSLYIRYCELTIAFSAIKLAVNTKAAQCVFDASGVFRENKKDFLR